MTVTKKVSFGKNNNKANHTLKTGAIWIKRKNKEPTNSQKKVLSKIHTHTHTYKQKIFQVEVRTAQPPRNTSIRYLTALLVIAIPI